MRLRPALFTVCVVILCFGGLLEGPSAHAMWPPSGIAVGGTKARAGFASGIPDGAGGWYVAWDDRHINPSSPDIRLQHISATGDPVAGWPTSAIIVSGLPTDELSPQVAPDGNGGVLVTWQDARNGSWDVYVQRYSFGGAIMPGWPAGGALATGAFAQQQNPSVATDGAGGAYLVWRDGRTIDIDGHDRCYAQHVTATGSIAAGWPADGLEVSPYNTSDQRIMSDGGLGCFVISTDSRGGGTIPDGIDVYGQHLLANGLIASPWQVNGNLVAHGRGAEALLPDGVGGLYATAYETTPLTSPEDARYWVYRYDANGVPSTGWTSNGVPLQATASLRNELSSAADSLGGVLVSWDDGNSSGGDVYANRVLPNGAIAPGWGPNGIPISDPNNPDEDVSSVGPDGTGGAYFAWEKVISGISRAYAQHFGPHGTIFPGWPASGLPTGTNTIVQNTPKVVHDGFGNALVIWHEKAEMAQLFVMNGIVATDLALVSSDARADRVALVWQGQHAGDLTATVDRHRENEPWQSIGVATRDADDRLRYEDRDVTPGERYAYRLGYTEGGSAQFTAETWVDVPSGAVFALEGLRPNPAVDAIRVTFSLPTASSATIDLLDLAGRRVIDREVGGLGVGRHVLRLDSGERIAPGVYWLRLRQGTQQALARAVVMR